MNTRAKKQKNLSRGGRGIRKRWSTKIKANRALARKTKNEIAKGVDYATASNERQEISSSLQVHGWSTESQASRSVIRTPRDRGRRTWTQARGRDPLPNIGEMLTKLRDFIDDPSHPHHVKFEVGSLANVFQQKSSEMPITRMQEEPDVRLNNNLDLKLEVSDDGSRQFEQPACHVEGAARDPAETAVRDEDVGVSSRVHARDFATDHNSLPNELEKMTDWLDRFLKQNRGDGQVGPNDDRVKQKYHELLHLQSLCSLVASKLNGALKILQPQIFNMESGYFISTYTPVTNASNSPIADSRGNVIPNSNVNPQTRGPSRSSDQNVCKEETCKEGVPMIFITPPENFERTPLELPTSSWAHLPQFNHQMQRGNEKASEDASQECSVAVTSAVPVKQECEEDNGTDNSSVPANLRKSKTSSLNQNTIEDFDSSFYCNIHQEKKTDWENTLNFLIKSKQGDLSNIVNPANRNDGTPSNFRKGKLVRRTTKKLRNNLALKDTLFDAGNFNSSHLVSSTAIPEIPKKNVIHQAAPTYQTSVNTELLNSRASESSSTAAISGTNLSRSKVNRDSLKPHSIFAQTGGQLSENKSQFTTSAPPVVHEGQFECVASRCDVLHNCTDGPSIPISTNCSRPHDVSSTLPKITSVHWIEPARKPLKDGSIQIISEHSYSYNETTEEEFERSHVGLNCSNSTSNVTSPRRRP